MCYLADLVGSWWLSNSANVQIDSWNLLIQSSSGSRIVTSLIKYLAFLAFFMFTRFPPDRNSSKMFFCPPWQMGNPGPSSSHLSPPLISFMCISQSSLFDGLKKINLQAAGEDNWCSIRLEVELVVLWGWDLCLHCSTDDLVIPVFCSLARLSATSLLNSSSPSLLILKVSSSGATSFWYHCNGDLLGPLPFLTFGQHSLSSLYLVHDREQTLHFLGDQLLPACWT